MAVADIDGNGARSAAQELAGHAGTIIAVPCDVGDKASVDDLFATVASKLGPAAHVSHNAGISISAGFLDVTETDFDEVIRVNLKGTFLVGQAAARQMVAAGIEGTIVTMSSVNAVMAIASIAPYVASKGGVGQLTKAMSLALADHGIRVNAVGPGSIDTDMLKSVNADAKAMAGVLSRTPLRRIGRAEEVADLVLYLSSDQSSYITGQTIYLDGGRLALNYTV